VAVVRTDISEELSASFIRVRRIGKLGTTLAVTSNRRAESCHPYEGGDKFLRNVGFLQELHSVTSQKTPFLLENLRRLPVRERAFLFVTASDHSGNLLSRKHNSLGIKRQLIINCELTRCKKELLP
jgi:hypothetical protein